jgi:hypothetical protein
LVVTHLKDSFGPDLAFYENMQDALLGKQLFKTSSGLLGYGNKSLRPGDTLCSLCDPFVLRRVADSDDGLYHLISAAYVHDMMNGEVEDLGLKVQDVTLC